MSFILSTFLLILIYSACGIIAGALQKSLGLLSVGHAAILGCGAYGYAVMTAKYGLDSSWGVVMAFLIGAISGIGLTTIAIRVKAERYALVSFGIHVAWIGLVTNVSALTGGVLGISGIPTLGSDIVLYASILVLIVLATYVFVLLEGTPLGAGCSVISQSIELAKTLGIRYSLIFAGLGLIYGAIIGLSGAILAVHLTFIDPTLFLISTSVTILSIAFFVVTQGAIGGLLGATLLVGVPQFVRLLGISSATAGYIQLMFSGIAIIIATILFFGDDRKQEL
ncbi:branched-chain amino acid ABC transporter permease [Nitrosomonas marina]|uniref:Amino acid/amide ABC transporter membrane protein 2, HAAT family n=1 Tax=Nitrosomonas marina TaxID=917 RepID=A0A1H8G3G3_9PROT|nr:branched-chain amino acid ABC transporter permease [Nitrosomonas marina]SEN38334.1 amino acid/amide ABC transporter membrane protein 2, HAAT family [Nitrosomonas marina]